MCFNPEFNPQTHSLELASGEIEQVAKDRGTILLKLYDDKGIIRDVYLQKTLYIPSYPHDIFSVRAALEKGGMVILKHNDGELILKDGTTFPISVKNELYYLDLKNKMFTHEIDAANSCKPPR